MSLVEPPPAARLLLFGGNVFDGHSGDVSTADVVIADGRVVEIGAGLDGDVAIDVTDQTVLPGFIDCHVHCMLSDIDMWRIQQTPFSLRFYLAARNLATTLRAGITTVRDAAGADYGIKQAVAEGIIPGPRLAIAITMLSQTGGHGDGAMLSGNDVPLLMPYPGAPAGVVDGVADVRLKVRELVRARADWIKVATTGGVLSEAGLQHRQFGDDELAEISAEAAAAGLDVMAHAHGAAGIKAAIRHGVRSVEHGVFLDDEAIELMVEHGTWLVPTLAAPMAVVEQARTNTRAALPSEAVEKAAQLVEVHARSFKRAVDAGVRVAMGSDTGVGRHGENLVELDLMARAGMHPLDVLRAATSSAATLLRMDHEIGYIRPGMTADIVCLRGDIQDLRAVSSRISTVVQGGFVIGPQT